MRPTSTCALAPVEAEVRKRLGNFIVAEDNESLEGVMLAELSARKLTLAVGETTPAATSPPASRRWSARRACSARA